MTKNMMNVDVILTFNEYNPGGNQAHFDVNIPVCPEDKDPVEYFHRELFPIVIQACQEINKDHKIICKISTSSNWGLYEKVTKNNGLHHNHSCKWYFGDYRDDMDEWEHKIVQEYGIGCEVKEFWFDKFMKGEVI